MDLEFIHDSIKRSQQKKSTKTLQKNPESILQEIQA